MKKNRTDLVLNINKPAGITSFKVIAIIRRALGMKKVGHAGTLDPFATGVLVVCTGRATRAIEYLMNSSKEYLALVEFGTSTTTGDPEGDIIQEAETSSLTKGDVLKVLDNFRGSIMQKPHAFSAVKHEGKRLYDLARQGKTPEIKARPVTIYGLELSDFTHYETKIGIKTRAYLRVRCSKGTYIRTLSEDIGKALGLPSYTVELKRTASGDFLVKDSLDLPLENVERHGVFAQLLQSKSISIDKALSFLPEIRCLNQFYRFLIQGQPLLEHQVDYQDSRIVNETVFLLKTSDNRLIGLHRYHGPNQRGFKKKQLSKPVKIFSPENPEKSIIRRIVNPNNRSDITGFSRVLCLGNFDGFHLGHKSIIKKAVELAGIHENTISSVLLFDPHPEFVVKNNRPELITTLEKKVKKIFAQAIQEILVISFEPEFAEYSPEKFVKDIIYEKTQAQHVVTGFNYRFGKHASGDVQDLGHLCSHLGITVHASKPVKIENITVSSTKIRSFLKKGNIEKAFLFSGHFFQVSGRVIHGFKRGRELGFPTANIRIENKHQLIPGPGVYHARVIINKNIYSSAVSIGNNPTFQGMLLDNESKYSKDALYMEAHILDFEGDLYDKILEFEFCEKLRNIVKYDDVENLIKQIQRDIKKIILYGKK